MLKETINNPFSYWMSGGEQNDAVIISSRIRLARNLQQMPFPFIADKNSAEQVIYAVRLALQNSDYSDYEVNNLNELSSDQMQILVEKHLISPNLLGKSDRAAVAISPDEKVCIMINEEDHIRIQCLLPGMQLTQGWKTADDIDDQLGKTLDYAFSDRVGYLTTCPTNVGTGLRASVMLHLPALVANKQIRNIVTAVSKLGMTIRGLYGEGTEASGNLFQISNQLTLGQSERNIISGLENITRQVVEQELKAEKSLYHSDPAYLEDKIYRSYGLLTNARLLNIEELMKMLSDLRLGCSLKIGPEISQSKINKLMVISQPSFLNNESGKKLSQQEQKMRRAFFCRQLLK